MIAASEPQEFVPYGRQKLKSHPGVVIPPSNLLGAEQLLVQQLSQVNIDSHKEKEWWSLREFVVGDGEGQIKSEEELYVREKTLVWSRGTVGRSVGNGSDGDLPSGRTLICCYTVESPITHALWVNFTKPINITEEGLMPSICVLDKSKVNIYTTDGEDFISTLQFKVSSVWSCKYGLLLERYTTPQLNDTENSLATLFSLLHPLDEMAPLLLMKYGGTLQYMNDSNLKVVFTNEDPSLVVLFDLRTSLHSVWKLRKATPQESKVFSGGEQSSYTHTSSLHLSNISQMSSGSFSLRGSLHNRTLHTPGNNSIPQTFSPFDALSRIQSPIDRFRSSLRTTSTPAMGHKTHTGYSSCSSSAMEARMGSSQSPFRCLREPRPIEPQLTIEYLWSENLGVPLVNKGVAVEPASRVFLSTDVLGQSFLCYLVKARAKLMVAKFNKENSDRLIGPATAIDALDAAPLLSLQMMSVLELGGGVTLYTGTTIVGKVHVAGIHTALASSSYLTCVTSLGFVGQSPYPKRSSLLPSTQMGDALFDENVHLLSPVTATPTTAHGGLSQHSRVNGLRDPVDNRLTLEFRSGIMFRIALPEICTSPLVKRCLDVLKCGLPSEVAVQLFIQWYTARNAPGSQDIPPYHEWQLFSKLIFCCLGYEGNTLSVMSDSPDTPVQVKKKRSSDLGSPEDWLYVIHCGHHQLNGSRLCSQLGLKRMEGMSQEPRAGGGQVNSSAMLFDYFHDVLYLLHLLYEELKLNLLMFKSLPLLAAVLQQLARDLRLHRYVLHYWQDFPTICPLTNSSVQLEERIVPQRPSAMPLSPPNIFYQLQSLLQRRSTLQPYPSCTLINPKSVEMLQLVGMLCSGQDKVDSLLLPLNINGSHNITLLPPKPAHLDIVQHCVYLLSSLGYTRRDLTMLPAGLALILNDAIHHVREDPPTDWPEVVYRLIGRQDLAATPPPPAVGERGTATPPLPAATRNNPESDDGMEGMDREILKLRFNKDQRVNEVRRLLISSQPVTIAICQRPEVSDHEFIEEQEKHLYTICTRTMALPVGRGMLTLHTTCPVASEPFSIPRLCLIGRAPPRGTTVDLTHIDVVPNMNLWPLFHNGVAAGLRINPTASNIDTAWIIYNKPKAGPEALPEHAGFLMALGLSGHLSCLAEPNACDYLSRSHEMTSIGILLGTAATKRGTMDLYTTKMLSLHVECLLPPTSVELDIPQNVQVAALVSVGLVYQATGHRHMTEILLSEMGRPPGPEMENSVDRESYSLAAGLALGMVVLGQGVEMSSLSDIGIADTLHYYMVGGNKRPLTGSQKEKYKSPSYQIREGDCVNIAVTSPGATLALGMMYFDTGNKAVASWMDAPDTQYLLDFVCPDALLLRTVAKGLVLWGDIRPSKLWVESHIPAAIRHYCLVKPHPGMMPDNLDLETMNQAYCNILAGACMALGLRFAGSSNNEAFTTLLHYCKMMTSLSGKSIAELVGKSTIEACINVIVVSLAMVMAGSGDLEVLRVCRYLHSRVGQPIVTYGSHIATHMALGMLFLGGGRYTLSTSPTAIAALLCAFFPKYPTHSNDNRYHLQALRHLYVLAAESRLVLPRDIDTGSLCYAHVTAFYLDTDQYKGQWFTIKAPCMLPELKYLEKVIVQDDRYWKVTFTRDKNWNLLQDMLTRSVGVKQRAGCLSYLEDPHGFRSLLAQTLTTDKAVAWTVPAESIFSFSSDPSTLNFAHYFLEQPEAVAACAGAVSELQVMQFLTKIVYECVTHDKLSIIPIWITIIKALQCLSSELCGPLVWQLKLLIAHTPIPSVAPDLGLSIRQHVCSVLDLWDNDLIELLVKYAQNQPMEGNTLTLQRLAVYLNFYDFPAPDILAAVLSGGIKDNLMLRVQLGLDVPVATVQKIRKLQLISQA